MLSTQQYLDTAISILRAASTEREAFCIQNTVYAVFIALEGILCGEGVLNGDIYTIDNIAYTISDGLPASLIHAYGLLGDECDGAVHVELARTAADLVRGFHVVRWADELTRIETEFGDACTAVLQPAWNYYGAVQETGELPADWIERARGICGLAGETTQTPAAAAPAPAPATAAATTPQPIAAESAPTQHSRASRFSRTRRVHGRRALTPVRSHRSTATTRRKH